MSRSVFLKSGEIYFATQRTQISTILGSCVSVCIWDKTKGYGGMCHYMLAKSKDAIKQANNYGEFAIINLIKEFKRHHCQPENLEAYLLGGGHVINLDRTTYTQIGVENIEIGRQILQHYGIPVKGQSIGGSRGRKLRFDTGNGELYFKFIGGSQSDQTGPEKIKVLIIDDSKSIRTLLKKMIEMDPEFKVVGQAENPIEALPLIDRLRPDVMTLDIQMPKMDGLSFLESYQPPNPVPAIIVSSLRADDRDNYFRAFRLGAFDYLDKPSLRDIDQLTLELQASLKAAARLSTKRTIRPKNEQALREPYGLNSDEQSNSILLMSGKNADAEDMRHTLIRLPNGIPTTILHVELPEIYLHEFISDLDAQCAFNVKELETEETLRSNCVYVLPAGKSLKLMEDGAICTAYLHSIPDRKQQQQISDTLFRQACHLTHLKPVAIFFGGRSKQGLDGLLRLRRLGNEVIVRDESSCILYGASHLAIEQGLASRVAKLTEFPRLILASCRRR